MGRQDNESSRCSRECRLFNDDRSRPLNHVATPDENRLSAIYVRRLELDWARRVTIRVSLVSRHYRNSRRGMPNDLNRRLCKLMQAHGWPEFQINDRMS